jgi:general secretion pathway protein A
VIGLYNDFFNFQSDPFSLTPDPAFMYLSPGHQEALEHMLYGIRERKGFVLVAGNIGAGKTTLTRLLLDQIPPGTHTALIFNTFLNEIELLRAINREFGLPADTQSREALIRELNAFLIEQLNSGGNAVLIIDEAQNLTVPVLEQIRMLSNLETDNQKLIQIILVGQPELARTLNRPELAQLNQRVTVRCYLKPLERDDTVRYVHHRLTKAGPQSTARFDPSALKIIHRLSGGVPRRINAICDRALLVAYGRGSQRIKPAHIRQAHQEINGEEHFRPPSRVDRLLPRVFIPAMLILLAVILAAYFGYQLVGASGP